MISNRHALHALLQDFGHEKQIRYSVAHAAPLPAAAPNRNLRALEGFLLGQAKSGLRSWAQHSANPAEDPSGGGVSLQQSAVSAAPGQPDFFSGFDQALASARAQGPATNSVLRGLFGIVPALLGRF